MPSVDGKNRLDALRKLLNQETLSTQDDLREKLEKLGHKVTQSTISRDLRKLGTVKVIDLKGQTFYRLVDEGHPPTKTASLADLVLELRANGPLIVIHTYPGSASLVARHLDQVRPGGILGTIAGDDTIFVAISSGKDSNLSMKEIETSFQKET